ncbi:hypothetical protein [Amycolatopsis sp. H20-H5]|nr:hypothetical protein [Amycolatopsis sp. H20-H5]MEC3977345.1 hypothetical protein [Amycolatopsis sp. H20-H5]
MDGDMDRDRVNEWWDEQADIEEERRRRRDLEITLWLISGGPS